MPDYQKSLIYKIICKDLNIKNVYIGSTTDFRVRKNQHYSYCNNNSDSHYNIYVYKFIRENGGWNNFKMVLIDYKPCNSKLELLNIERKYIENIDKDLLLNKQLPSRTNKEWRNVNPDKRDREYFRQYEKDNFDKIKKEKGKKIECNKCGSIVNKGNIKSHQKTKKCINLFQQGL